MPPTTSQAYLPRSRSHHRKEPHTPPPSPKLAEQQLDTLVDLFKQLLVRLDKEKAEEGPGTVANTVTSEPPTTDKALVKASKLEYKSVIEVWDSKANNYKLEEPCPTEDVSEFDEYIFVARVRIKKDTSLRIHYVDIKSSNLRDILRQVFSDVKTANLREDKPSIERELLYHYLPELDSCLAETNLSDSISYKHLNLLIEFVKDAYADTTQALALMLEHGEISYDLLPLIFKPNEPVYTTCFGTEKPRCVKYDTGNGISRLNGGKYYELECRYLDFDGDILGEVSTTLLIPKFRGAVRINTLAAFPLEYHSNPGQIKADLIKNGHKFVSLCGMHHRYCRGQAFFVKKEEAVKHSVDGRIMIDAAFFRQMNPNYTRPKVDGSSSAIHYYEMFGDGITSTETTEKVHAAFLNLQEPDDSNLLYCCPTVRGFGFKDKLWLEFAVADIEPIEWSSEPFNCLAIPSEYKEIILALVEARTKPGGDVDFDDFVTGKGRGTNVLLHGPPGVGKTLTAEAVSEHMRLPFYSISAGELSLDAGVLEGQLSKIFQIAKHCKAVLLLDEADVYFEARSRHEIQRNGLVSVFLRELEYCECILFMTTNGVDAFDTAIISRIHLPLKYRLLPRDAKKQICKNFLARMSTQYGPAEISETQIDFLAAHSLNGRQIKNFMSTAQTLAKWKESSLTFSHIKTVMDTHKKFDSEFNGAEHTTSVFN